MEPLALEPFYRLGAALLAGALIGFERGWRKRDDPEGTRTAGLRTFSLIGLFGGIAGSLEPAAGAVAIAAGFLAVAALALGMYLTAVKAHGNIGATTEVATLVAFGFGALAGRGEIVLALAGAVVTVALLDIKAPLHGFLQRVRHDEFRAAIKLMLVSAVLLPILPDRGYGPEGILNPYRLWWIVVLVAGLSLAGHFALRFTGPRTGPLLMGLVGGLISSTAVTASAARLAARKPRYAAQQAAGVAAAKSVMCLRVLVVAAVLSPSLLPSLAPALIAAAAAAIGLSLAFRRQAAAAEARDDDATNADAPVPNDLGTAVAFAAAMAVTIVATHYARLWLGTAGVYATAALAGLVDVDAVTVTAAMSNAAPGLAAGAILVAAAVNTLAKIAIAAGMGPRDFTRRVAVMAAAVIAAGATGALAASLLG